MDNIAKIAGRDSFAYQGERPWHGLGVKVPGAMTVEEAIKAGNLDWRVEKRSIMTADTEMVEVPNVYAIGRVGPELNNLGEKRFIPFEATVKDRYTIVQNEEAFDFFNAALGEGAACMETVGALGNGQQIFAMAKVPDTFEPLPGDPMECYILLSTSHDGSSQIMATFTTIRVVCWNTLSAAIGSSNNVVKIRHTKSAKKKLETAHELLHAGETYWNRLNKAYNTMAMRDMTRLDVMQFIANLFPGKKEVTTTGQVIDVPSTRTQNNRDKVFNLFEGEALGSNKKIAGTPYQMLQAVTQYIDRERSVRKNTNRWESSTFGSGRNTRQKAFNDLWKFTQGSKTQNFNEILQIA